MRQDICFQQCVLNDRAHFPHVCDLARAPRRHMKWRLLVLAGSSLVQVSNRAGGAGNLGHVCMLVSNKHQKLGAGWTCLGGDDSFELADGRCCNVQRAAIIIHARLGENAPRSRRCDANAIWVGENAPRSRRCDANATVLCMLERLEPKWLQEIAYGYCLLLLPIAVAYCCVSKMQVLHKSCTCLTNDLPTLGRGTVAKSA